MEDLLVLLAELRSKESEFTDLTRRIASTEDNIRLFSGFRKDILSKPGVLKPEYRHLADADEVHEVPLQESFFNKTRYFEDAQMFSTSEERDKLEELKFSLNSLKRKLSEILSSCTFVIEKLLRGIEGESPLSEILFDLKDFKSSFDFSRIAVMEAKLKLMARPVMPRNVSPRLESKMSSDAEIELKSPSSPLNQAEALGDLKVKFAEIQSYEKEYKDLQRKISNIRNNIDIFSKLRREILEKDGVLKPEFKNIVLDSTEEIPLEESMFLKPLYFRDAKQYSTIDSHEKLVENQARLDKLTSSVFDFVTSCSSDVSRLSKSRKGKVEDGILKDLNEFKESLDFNILKMIAPKLRMLEED